MKRTFIRKYRCPISKIEDNGEKENRSEITITKLGRQDTGELKQEQWSRIEWKDEGQCSKRKQRSFWHESNDRAQKPNPNAATPSELEMTRGREPVRSVDLGKHSIYTHFPKDRNCDICLRTKITRVPCRRRNGEAVPRAENFGDLITADHKVPSENCESRNNHRHAVVVQDLATQWIQSFPSKTKASQETQRSLQKFLEPERKPKVIYNDNSLEFGKACEDLSWNHCTSTPHRSETNGIVERAVRRVKEGTSAVLLQSGLNESWWADSMECYTYLRNVTDLLSDGKTPYERRFGQPFKGPIIPFGSLVEYHPITAKDQSRIHQFWKESVTWIVPRIRSLRGENLEG